MDWQPIETAPKDGTRVDLWAKCWSPRTDTFTSFRFTDCFWNATEREWKGSINENFHATHWMPLPAPPEVSRG